MLFKSTKNLNMLLTQRKWYYNVGDDYDMNKDTWIRKIQLEGFD